MSEYTVKRAERKLKRDINKVFSNDFLKIITEIILNSDDSYKRLEQPTKENIQTIKIILNRRDKKVSIIDYAEGMTDLDFRHIFTEYGAQHNLPDNYDNIRGLFGQGASDVLFFGAQIANLGKIESIKDNYLHTCKFFLSGGEQKIKIKKVSHKQQIKNFMRKHGFTENGTVVTFGLGDKVRIPQKSQIKNKIESFYMLRYVLADPYRKVILKHDNKDVLLSSEKYQLTPKNLIQKSTKITFKHEEHIIEGYIDVYEDVNNDKDDMILIVDDQQRVYDNTLFGLEETPGASRIRGKLVIHNLYTILNDYLNKEQPEEILRDSRDGFDQRNLFTKKLFLQCKPVVSEQIKKMNEKHEQKTYNLDSDKTLKKALRKINNYYQELKLEEIGNLNKGKEPPGEGIKFVRDVIYITKNKTYDLKLLINPSIISSDEKILINVEPKDGLNLITKALQYKKTDIDEYGLVTKSVVLKGKKITEFPLNLTANAGSRSSRTLVHIVEEKIIYPENGLQFSPEEIKLKPGRSYTLQLYVDINTFPYGKAIQITKVSNRELFPEEFSVPINEDYRINDLHARIPIKYEGGLLFDYVTYEAACDDIRTKAKIRVMEPDSKDKGLEGLFSGIDGVKDSNANWQSSFSKDDGRIKINLSHIINRTILKNLKPEALQKLELTDENYHFIFDLITFECAKQIVKIKLEKNEISDDPNTVLQDIQNDKTKLYKSIYGDTK